MAEDVRTIADDDLADRRVFEEEGSPEEGGDNADRLRLREELARSIAGTLETRPNETPAES
jgi:hypothetical protein